MNVSITLDRFDLVKASKDKPSYEIRIEDFPSKTMKLIYIADYVEFIDQDGCYKILKER